MDKSEKRMIAILVAITIIVIIVAIIWNNNTKNKKIEENATPKEEFVNVLEDGTRVNNSNKLHEKKVFDGMEFTDLKLTERGNVTVLLGKITNTSSTTKGGYLVNVKLVDKQGNEIITIEALLPELAPGQSTELNTGGTLNFANAYDFIITKK